VPQGRLLKTGWFTIYVLKKQQTLQEDTTFSKCKKEGNFARRHYVSSVKKTGNFE